MARCDIMVRQWEILAVLLDGKSHTIEAFEGLREKWKVTKKTIWRDLDTLSQIPKFKITVFKKFDQNYYRCDAKLIKEEPTYLSKKCSYCRKTKHIEEFHKTSSSPDRHKSVCAKCCVQYNREWREKNREYYNKRVLKQYFKNHEHILQQRRDRNAKARTKSFLTSA